MLMAMAIHSVNSVKRLRQSWAQIIKRQKEIGSYWARILALSANAVNKFLSFSFNMSKTAHSAPLRGQCYWVLDIKEND